MLDDLISSLLVQSSPAYTLYIIDATDPSDRQLIPRVRKIERSVVYLPSENHGYASSVNTGISHAVRDGSFHLAVINPDVVLDTDFVLHATQSLASHPRTIIGGKIYYAPGYEYHTKSPPIETIPYPTTGRNFTIWYAGGEVDWDHATVAHRGVDMPDDGIFDTLAPTQIVTGCCLLYDKTVHDTIGSWDDRYFMYFEDADLCVRAQRKGVKVIYDPSIVMWHKNAQSTGGSGSDFQRIQMAKSRLRFGLKYAPLRTKFHLIKNHVLAKG